VVGGGGRGWEEEKEQQEENLDKPEKEEEEREEDVGGEVGKYRLHISKTSYIWKERKGRKNFLG
jgi:hypothetical protein